MLRFEVSRSVITVQREFRARFRKDAWCVWTDNGRIQVTLRRVRVTVFTVKKQEVLHIPNV